MTDQETKECKIASVVLKGISKSVLVLFLTIPITLTQIHDHSLSLIQKSIVLFFICTCLYIAFKSWHLFFDSVLFKNLAREEFDISVIDQAVYPIFNKKIKNKTLNNRIQACYKQVRFYIFILIIHLIFFIEINLWVLFHS